MSVREEDLPSGFPKRLSEEVEAVGIVVAAGRSSRIPGDLPKQLIPLEGVPLVVWSVRALAAARGVVGVLTVHPPGLGTEIEEALEEAGIEQKLPGVAGGASRQESVARGFEALPEGPDVVLVHDAARPLASPALAERILAAAAHAGAAAPVLPIVETLKEVAGEEILRTLDRTRFFVSQTPQGFQRAVLRRALHSAREDGILATDEAALVERMGGRVAAVPGEADNLKVTFPEDLDLAAFRLGSKG